MDETPPAQRPPGGHRRLLVALASAVIAALVLWRLRTNEPTPGSVANPKAGRGTDDPLS